jgi:hypothetical protein
MVHNITRLHRLPHTSFKKSHTIGGGMGAVLMSKGGPGCGSSYMNLEDYEMTTGIDPYNRDMSNLGPPSRSSGGSLTSHLKNKLGKLEIGGKKKNIVMSF